MAKRATHERRDRSLESELKDLIRFLESGDSSTDGPSPVIKSQPGVK